MESQICQGSRDNSQASLECVVDTTTLSLDDAHMRRTTSNFTWKLAAHARVHQLFMADFDDGSDHVDDTSLDQDEREERTEKRDDEEEGDN